MAYRPFCSARCADVDLGRWLDGRYRIPAEEPPDGLDEPAEEASAAGCAQVRRNGRGLSRRALDRPDDIFYKRVSRPSRVPR